jgi:hypothetical protein
MASSASGAKGEAAESRKFHAHERWRYDENGAVGVAHLLGVGVVCRLCHSVHHIGRTRLIAADDTKYSGWADDAAAHFCCINNAELAAFEAHEAEATADWRRRNEMEWTVDWGPFSSLV